MNFEEFLNWAESQNPIFSRQIPYVLAYGESGVYFVRDLMLLMAFEEDSNEVRLGFLDLRKRVLLAAESCEALEEDSTLWAEADDVPWPGYTTKFAFSVYPIGCEGGHAYGFVAVKINTTSEKLFFNWGAVAYSLLRDRAEEYLQELNRKIRVVDAVEVV